MGLIVARLAIHTCHQECNTLVAPFEIAATPKGTMHQRRACGMSIQRVIQDPIPFLILLGLLLLTVWLLQRFSDR